jgi:hypothetical protein
MKGKESLKEQVDLIRATAESIVISNEKDLKMATDFTKEVKEKQKIIKDFYEPMVKATKESYDKIKAERDNLLKPLQDTEKEMRSLMNEYNNKLLLLKRAEEERIRKEKENQEKKLEEIQKDIAKGNTDNVQQRVTEIMNTTTLSEKTVNIPKVAGMSTRTTYKIEITDINKIPTTLNNIPLVELSKVGKDYLLQQYKIMKALNQEFKIPGIEIKEEVTTVIR